MPHACLLNDDHAYPAMTRRAHHRSAGLTEARPVSQNRHRLALAAERQDRCRRRHITAGASRANRLARAADLPLNIGASLIVILLLSLGLWAAIWGIVASLASVVLK